MASSVEIKRYGEKVLREPCKDVTKFSAKLRNLIEDLLKAMYAANGVGLAASQIGVAQRVFVVDTNPVDQPPSPIVFVNPRIVKKEGGVLSHEGCLSFPSVYIDVRRFERVVIKAKDHANRPFTLDVSGGTLLCRAIQHEYDHLDGVLFIDHSMDKIEANKALSEQNLPPVQDDYILQEPELEELIASQMSTISDDQEVEEEDIDRETL